MKEDCALEAYISPWRSLMIFHEEAGLITALTAEVFRHTHPAFLLSAGRIRLFFVGRAMV